MTQLLIEVTSELEQRLAREAAARGLTVPDYARSVLEEALPAGSPLTQVEEGPADLVALATAQGAPLAARFEDLLGDFWPEEESADEFIAAVREWRREGTLERP
jgi:hypothetical protein